jgi:transketolase
MALSRQNLPVLDAVKYQVFEGVRKGAYRLDGSGQDLVLVATGSEVGLIMQVAEKLKGLGIHASVVSMPSFKIFEEQSPEYQASIFPRNIPTISVEAGATLGWWKYVGRDGLAIGIDRFGASAPGAVVLEKLGISVDHVVDAAKRLLKR